MPFRRYFLFFCLLNLQLCRIVAQSPADTLRGIDPLEDPLSSPYLALRSFVEAFEDGASTTFPQLFVHPEYNRKDRVTVARHLKQVLDGTGITLYLEEAPQDPNYKDTLSGKHRYVLVDDQPNIYLEKKNNRWHFPRRAVDEIETWHGKVFPFGMDKLLNLLPKIGVKKIGPFRAWQVVALFALILLTVLIRRVLSLGSERLFIRFLLRRGYGTIAHEYLLPVVRPFSWALIFTVLWIFLPVLQLPARLSHYVILGLGVVAPIFFATTLYYCVDILHVYLLQWVKKTESTLDDQLMMLLRKVLKVFVLTLGALFALDNLSVPILPLLTDSL